MPDWPKEDIKIKDELSEIYIRLNTMEDRIKDLEDDNIYLEKSLDRFHGELFTSQEEYLDWKIKLKEDK
jgi:predicted nuclease with TOPRIM domain